MANATQAGARWQWLASLCQPHLNGMNGKGPQTDKSAKAYRCHIYHGKPVPTKVTFASEAGFTRAAQAR